jgi:hypothetical protein
VRGVCLTDADHPIKTGHVISYSCRGREINGSEIIHHGEFNEGKRCLCDDLFWPNIPSQLSWFAPPQTPHERLEGGNVIILRVKMLQRGWKVTSLVARGRCAQLVSGPAWICAYVTQMLRRAKIPFDDERATRDVAFGPLCSPWK